MNNALFMVILATKVTFSHSPVTLPKIISRFQMLQQSDTPVDDRSTSGFRIFVDTTCEFPLAKRYSICTKTNKNLNFRNLTTRTQIKWTEAHPIFTTRRRHDSISFRLGFPMNRLFDYFWRVEAVVWILMPRACQALPRWALLVCRIRVER